MAPIEFADKHLMKDFPLKVSNHGFLGVVYWEINLLLILPNRDLSD